MFELANPFISLGNSFTGIFGSDNYSSTNRLLNVHMSMLDNISSKLDNVQKALIYILEHQSELEKAINAIPSKTVEELFKKNLEGLFIILREKIEAYIIEKENSTLSPQKTKLIFDEILRELQVSRGRIMAVNEDIYLNLPVVVTCLHFEIFCMTLADQPISYVKIVLKSYKTWLEKVISAKLKTDFDFHNSEQYKLIEQAQKLFTYTKNKESVTKKKTITILDGAGDYEKEVNAQFYRINFSKYNYKLVQSLNDGQLGQIQLLLDSGLIEKNELPLNLAINLDSKIDIIYDFPVSNPAPSDFKPIPINENFKINESNKELSENTIGKSIEIINPLIGEDAKTKTIELNENGYRLIMYSSLIHVGKIAIETIDRLSNNPINLKLDSLLEFATKQENVSRINNERVKIWVKYIQNKIDLVEDEETKTKILEIKDRMQLLQENSKDILANYSKLEKELADAIPQNILSGIFDLLEPVGKELEIGVQNILREHEKFVKDLGRNVEKAVQDISRELEVAGQNVGGAVEAAGGFVENQFQSYGEIIDDAQKRVREGKIIDALWHISTDHFKHTEDNASIAFMKSSVLTSIASSAASIYGGPAGGAAFAAWLTYKQTGDLELALKTAAITYFTQQSLSAAKTITGTDVTDIAKRTLVTSAIGAAAIAASGGSEKDIIDGFLKGAALNLANDYYKSYMNSNINDEIPTEDALDKNYDDIKNQYGILTDKQGKPILVKIINEKGMKEWITQIAPSKIPANIPQVGISSVETGFFSGSEHSWPMQKLAKIPGFNSMARFHDQWCAVNQIEGITTQVTIIPAIALTITGRNQVLIDKILEELNKNEEE